MKLRFKTLAISAAVIVLLTLNVDADERTINGAGASFPYPVYSQWAYKYNKITGVRMNYQSIGSGGGIAQIKAKTVDFGASDKPLKIQELKKAGLVQFPMVMGGVVPVVNVKGVKPGQMKLDSSTLVDIFMGKIARWNDPRITKLNPSLNLPGQKIAVVHRADGSGTTWIFTNYLSKVSKEWKKKVGNGKAVSWPTGQGGKGNEGVANYVRRLNGSIGYVEFAYALQNKLCYTALKNRDGKYIQPSMDTFQAAAANADWKNSPGFYVVLTDQPGNKSWPITGATFILVYKNQEDEKIAKNVLDFFAWGYKHGDDIARKLHYVPMPDSVVKTVQDQWKSDIKSKGKKVWR